MKSILGAINMQTKEGIKHLATTIREKITKEQEIQQTRDKKMSHEKYIPYRNKKILETARGEFCQLCGRYDGTIVAAHSNLLQDGKGVGKKSDDCFIAFLCYVCHVGYDRHKISQEDFHLAMKRTWKILLTKGILK